MEDERIRQIENDIDFLYKLVSKINNKVDEIMDIDIEYFDNAIKEIKETLYGRPQRD